MQTPMESDHDFATFSAIQRWQIARVADRFQFY